LCLEADASLLRDTENARRFGVDQALIDAADDAELELHWLYPNLITFAIQHLAVGILLKRDPQRIIDEGSQLHVSKAVRDCGVSIDAATSDLLSNVENAFRWGESLGENSPRWNVRLSAEHIQLLKRYKPYMMEISETQKQAFDDVFNQLDTIAAQEVGAETSPGVEPKKQRNGIGKSV